MADCCHSADLHFGPTRAHQELTKYRDHGATGTARIILDLLHEVLHQPRTLLDIGAGIGVLHHELLAGSVDSAIHVEGASAYVAVARAEAARRGHQERIQFLQGDAVALAGELPSADLVTLDRVLCCYPDLDPLVRVTTARARQYYAVSVPHDRWYMRAHTTWKNFTRRRSGNPFRTFVHRVDRIRHLIHEAGLELIGTRRTLAWEVSLYERPAPPKATSLKRPSQSQGRLALGA